MHLLSEFVYRIIRHSDETGEIPITSTKLVMEAERGWVLRKPIRKQAILACEIKISPSTVSRIYPVLYLRAYKNYPGNLLIDKLKGIRYER